VKDNRYIEDRGVILVENGALIERHENTRAFEAAPDDLAGVTVRALTEGMQSAHEHLHGEDEGGTIEVLIEYEPKDRNLLSDWEVERLNSGSHISQVRTSSLLFTLERGDVQLGLAIDFPYTDNEGEMLARVGDYIHNSLGVITDVKLCTGLADAPAWTIDVTPHADLMLNRCTEIAQCVDTLLRYQAVDPETPEGAASLLLSGQPSFLIGRPENSWLEAKQSYGIASRSQKHEFACDVASFANSNTGGLIIIGVKTDKDLRGRDVMTEMTPCRAGSINLQTYQQAVAERVIPAIEGISFDVVEVENGDLLVVRIPPQEGARMPFIVKGGIIDSSENKIRTSSFSIPARRSEGKDYMTPEWVHSLLASGRAFMAYQSQTNPTSNSRTGG
jgi:hypothetical protein